METDAHQSQRGHSHRLYIGQDSDHANTATKGQTTIETPSSAVGTASEKPEMTDAVACAYVEKLHDLKAGRWPISACIAPRKRSTRKVTVASEVLAISSSIKSLADWERP
jgi:hypothetical protein